MYLTLETCIKWIKIPVVVFEWGRIKVEEIFLSSLSAFADPDNFPFSRGGGDSRYICDDFLQYVKLKYLFISSGVHTSEPPLDPHILHTGTRIFYDKSLHPKIDISSLLYIYIEKVTNYYRVNVKHETCIITWTKSNVRKTGSLGI